MAMILLATSDSHAKKTEPIVVRLSGVIVDQACIAENINSDVYLGRWSTRQISSVGARSQPVSFRLKLTGCPQGPVSVSFTGPTDELDRELLALNSKSQASGVAIEISDSSGLRLPLNNASQKVHADAQGNAELSFFANYIATRHFVSAGRANADVNFKIVYD